MEKNTKLKLYYDEEHKSKKNNSSVRIFVDYFSHTEIDLETASRIRNSFKSYMSKFNCDRKDIIDIISKVRDLTENLDEYKLEVRIEKENYREFASYERGRSETCGVFEKNWDDYIGVIDTYRGIDVQYKVDRFHVYNASNVKTISDTLFKYYEKVIKLNNMTKEKQKVYEK